MLIHIYNYTFIFFYKASFSVLFFKLDSFYALSLSLNKVQNLYKYKNPEYYEVTIYLYL